MYKPRNPFTPGLEEVLSPQKYLERHVLFQLWNVNNPVTHLETCRLPNRHQVMNHGMCCIAHLKQCIDEKMFDLAGCRNGVFVEPAGFREWLNLALIRLEELESGQDDFGKWHDVLTNRDDLNNWIFESDHDTCPGFSLAGFKALCKKHGYFPNLFFMAKNYRESILYMLKFWFFQK